MNPSSRDSNTSKKLNLKSSANYSPLPHNVLIFGVVTQLVQPAEFVACAINTDSTQGKPKRLCCFVANLEIENKNIDANFLIFQIAFSQ